MFQSTHPRGVRHNRLKSKVARIVSIHAPAGGATRIELAYDASTKVSIHAPAGGATQGLAPPKFILCFNPRTRGGCDEVICQQAIKLNCFNPRTRGGCDRLTSELKVSLRQFQSTHPRGVRPLRLRKELLREVSIHAPAGGATTKPQGSIIWDSFNPRTRGGCDG